MVSVEKVLIALLLILTAAFLNNVAFGSSSLPTPYDASEGFVPLLPGPTSNTSHLLDYYPNLDPTGKLGDKDASQLWQEYPIFRVGSYDQVTNNIRYPVNPDVGQCRPESICNVMYGDRETKVPEFHLPVAGKVRVNLYTTNTPPFY
jgi:hypothetical protein